MKTRKEIIDELKADSRYGANYKWAILEVLLDVRELLARIALDYTWKNQNEEATRKIADGC